MNLFEKAKELYPHFDDDEILHKCPDSSFFKLVPEEKELCHRGCQECWKREYKEDKLF